MNIVVTEGDLNRFCKCEFCKSTIAEFVNEKMLPSAEECYNAGNVPIPNFGWFCSQKCALDYESKFDIRFEKTKEGKIDYYLSSPNS